MKEILVVEDDKSVSEAIVEILATHEYKVAVAEDGLDALEKIKSSVPDLILSDVMMPKIDGFELKEILKRNKNLNCVPFIFLSAKSCPDDIRHGMNLGADDYITKPFKAKELLKVIEIRLEKIKMLNEKVDEIINNMDLYIPHEFRTPLNSLLGYSELLLENGNGLDCSELKEMHVSINKSAKRLHAIIEKMTLLQSFNNGKGKYEVVVDNPNSGNIEDSVLSVINEYGRKDDLKLNLDNAEIKFNTIHLKFVISQIIDNACKFSKHGSSIVIKSIKEKNSYIIEISDYGKGMTNEQLFAINAFVQFDKHKDQQVGNGLGLYLSKKIIEHYGGKLSIFSQVRKYTTVKIELGCK